MQENLLPSIDLIVASEGGYVDDPAGGPTNMGITLATLTAWRKKPTTAQDLMALAVTEAEDIYVSEYAAKIAFQSLPSGLDYACLDYCVNSGPAQAAKELQVLVGTTPDGIIGAKTLAAVASLAPGTAIPAYCAARLDFMKSLRNWAPNANGWTARVARVEGDAVKMATGSMVIPKALVAPASSTKATGAVKVTATGSGRAALATLGSVIVTAGVAAGQATAVMQPYVDIAYVKYGVIALTVVAALGTFIVAYRRSQSGATT